MGEDSRRNTNGQFGVNDLEVDLDRRSVRRKGQLIELPDLSFRLLAILVSRAPNDVAKDELIREVWGDVIVGDETLAQRVRLLRQALGEDKQNSRYISAVRGRGYRLICEVTPRRSLDQRESRKWGLIIASATIVVTVATAYFVFNTVEELLIVESAPIELASIAVLPFSDLSPDQNHRYFADGMQEELLNRLTKLQNVEVLSRTTVEPYRNTELSLPDIAKSVGANTVIEGSIRIAHHRVRITVQLIDAETDRHLWAENFDRELSMQNIFSIQGEVADQIAMALELEYETIPLVEQVAIPTTSLEAYDAYLLGRYHTFKQTSADLDLAVKYLEKATTLDAEFAEAYTALGWAYSFIGTTYGRQAPRDVFPRAKEAVLAALALDSELANAHSLYGDILTWFDWDFVAAEREYLRTIELDPLNVLGYALFLSTQMRHDEAVAAVEKQLAAYPDDSYAHINAAWRFYNARRYDRAIEEATLAEDHADATTVLTLTYLALGEPRQAIEIAESEVRKQKNAPRLLANLASAYFKSGDTTAGNRILTQLEALAAEEYMAPNIIATAYFAAGDADKGFALLQKGFEARTRQTIFLQVNHAIDDYRDDPRYKALIGAVGF